MKKKGYISETVEGGRIVSHGQITDLSNGFKLPDGERFTIYVRPKQIVQTFDTVISVRLYQDDEFSPAPFTYNDWSPCVISEIAPDTEVLNTNDIYWGSGQAVSQEGI